MYSRLNINFSFNKAINISLALSMMISSFTHDDDDELKIM